MRFFHLILMGPCLSKTRKVDILSPQNKQTKSDTFISTHKMETEEIIPTQDDQGLLGKEAEVDGVGMMEGKNEQEQNDDTSEEVSKKPQKILTPEEIEEKANTALESVKKKTSDMQSSWSTVSEDGYFPVQTRNLVLILYKSYFALKGAPLERIVLYRKTVIDLMLETKAVDIACEVYKYYAKMGWAHEVDGVQKSDKTRWFPFLHSTLVLLNYSDLSETFAAYISNYPGLLESIKHILVDRKEAHLQGEQKDNALKTTGYALSLSHNISMRDENTKFLKDLDFTSAVKPYLQSPHEMTMLNALATLASIIDEQESEIINANPSSVKLLLKCIAKGLEKSDRRHNGWSIKESLYTLRMLARNDGNKKLLYELGAVELLVKVGQTGSDDEKYECVQAIWTLAFDQEIRKSMVEKEELGLVELLQDIKQTCDLPPVKKACNGAFWTMRDELKESSNVKYQQIGSAISGHQNKIQSSQGLKKKKRGPSEGAGPDEGAESGHIMISYQWANQKTLIQIRDVLKAHGLKVWMDIDQMAGSTLQSMADAVENADIVLMAMSQKYKDSPNCRAEAEYAFTKHKKIIPLLMERGYRADGWLGFILGAKLFFEFSGKYPFDVKMNDLLKQIDVFKQRKSGGEIVDMIKPDTTSTVTKLPVDTVDHPQSYHPLTMPTIVTKTTINSVRQWKPADVQNWINKNDLKSCGLTNLTGGEVALLMTMRQEAPEFFYKCLQTMLNVNNLLNMSKIVWALTDLADQR